jgi:hypothetical protein
MLTKGTGRYSIYIAFSDVKNLTTAKLLQLRML